MFATDHTCEPMLSIRKLLKNDEVCAVAGHLTTTKIPFTLHWDMSHLWINVEMSQGFSLKIHTRYCEGEFCEAVLCYCGDMIHDAHGYGCFRKFRSAEELYAFVDELLKGKGF